MTIARGSDILRCSFPPESEEKNMGFMAGMDEE